MSRIQESIAEFERNVADMRVCVIGETIIDRFVEVQYEGQSMKSFCPVFRLVHPDDRMETQEGGAAAIANHLRDFVKHVDLVTNDDGGIVKTRLIDADDAKKHVEINKFDRRNFGEVEVDADQYDAVIVADFGHGFCDGLRVNGEFHFMAQTNSNNFGYNRMSKWKKHSKRGACLDMREASLQVNRRKDCSGPEAVRELYGYEINAEHLFLTLGREGSVYFDGENYYRQDIFRGPVVDTIGAGDTFFAFASLAAQRPPKNREDIMLVPSLAASLACTWLCNAESVTRKSLAEYALRFI